MKWNFFAKCVLFTQQNVATARWFHPDAEKYRLQLNSTFTDSFPNIMIQFSNSRIKSIARSLCTNLSITIFLSALVFSYYFCIRNLSLGVCVWHIDIIFHFQWMRLNKSRDDIIKKSIFHSIFPDCYRFFYIRLWIYLCNHLFLVSLWNTNFIGQAKWLRQAKYDQISIDDSSSQLTYSEILIYSWQMTNIIWNFFYLFLRLSHICWLFLLYPISIYQCVLQQCRI